MASNLETARAYYEAAEARDGAALIEILHPAVELRLTEGLPDGLGGAYEGREAALGALRQAAEAFDPVARPEQLLSAEDDHVLVLGQCIGRGGVTGRSFEAAFAHVLRLPRGGRGDGLAPGRPGPHRPHRRRLDAELADRARHRAHPASARGL